MKKYFKLIVVIGCLFLVTGCVKYNATMDIKKDKSMDFSMIYAVDTSIFGNEDILEEKDRKELEDSGFTISEYNEGNMKGYTIKMNISNIDQISSNEEIVYNLTNITDNNNKDEKIFTIKKGLLKNTYKANLKFDSADSNLNGNNTTTEEDTKNNDITTEWDTEDSSIDWDTESDSGNWDALTNSASNLDLSFKVNLPYSAIKTNATQTSNDNKELTWSLTSNEVSNIEFEFSLYNTINIIVITVIILILIVAIIIFFINNKKNNNNKSIVSENIDQSNIEKQVINNVMNNEQIINSTSTNTVSENIITKEQNINEQVNYNNEIVNNIQESQQNSSALTEMYSRENTNQVNNSLSNNQMQNTNNITQSGIITNASQQNINTENNQINNNNNIIN